MADEEKDSVEGEEGRRHLLLRLDAPLMSFGGASVDNWFPTAEFPFPSMLAGLMANALGLSRHREDAPAIQGIQDRLRYAVRQDVSDGKSVLADFQTASLSRDDAAWTTFGEPEKRSGSPQTYASPQIRWREYVMDARLTVAMRLDPEGEYPSLRRVESALRKPLRPLFAGRESCPLSSKLLMGSATAKTAVGALADERLFGRSRRKVRFIWQAGEEDETVAKETGRFWISGASRDWRFRIHGGEAEYVEGEALRREER